MDPIITPFVISLAAGTVIEVFKATLPVNIKRDIEKAFNDALKKCSKNTESAKRTYKFSLNSIIRENYKKDPNADLRDESITGIHSKFFIEFEEALAKRGNAYSFIKENRAKLRYQDLKEGIEKLEGGQESIIKEVTDVKELLIKSNTGSLQHEYLGQLEQYQKNLEAFNPTVALDNIEALEKRFSQNCFSPDNVMKSNIELLKAKCYSLITGKTDDTFTSYINAYNLNTNSNEAKVLACYAYLETGNKTKIETLLNEICVVDEFNPIAWAIKTVLTDSNSLLETLEEIPDFIIRNIIFKRFLFFISIKSKKYKDIHDAFEKHQILLNINVFDNTNLTYENYKERLFLIESIILRFTRNTYINFLKEEEDNNIDIKPIYDILTNFLDGIKNSELDNFTVVKFYHAYFKYLINRDKDSVYLMKDLYIQIKNKQERYMLWVANSLQKEGDLNGAIELINQSEVKSETALILEMFCWEQKKNPDEYVKVTKQFLNSIKQISINDSERIFGIIEDLISIQKLNEFETEDFIKEKEFETVCLKVLLTEYINVFKEDNNEETKVVLNEITQDILSLADTRIKYKLARLFYFLKDFQKAVYVFENFIDVETESEELHYYIQSLFYGKLNQKRLLELIANWRNNFSLNLVLLKIEINLNFKLYKYDTIVKICQKYLETKKGDEYILTNYVIALYNSDNEYIDEFKEFTLLIKDFDFQYPNHAILVANILKENSFFNEAFLIYYNSAVKFPEAKSVYSFINIPSELDEKHEVVKEGVFIQYGFGGKDKIDKITSDLPFSKYLIGKRVGDKIEIDKKIGKLKQTISIKAILNKYEALKLQIFDEVYENDPLSEIPMQLFNFKEHLDSSGGNIIDFFNDIVGEDNYDEDKREDIEKYHIGEVSFTEIVLSYYSLNFVKAYFDLKYEQNGLFQIHPNKYPYIDFNYYDYFILDFTSLLLFYGFTEKHNANFNRKFVLPTSTKTIIKHYRSERFVVQGKSYLLDSVFYDGLLKWIDDNCECKMAVSKLDIVSKMPNNNKPNIIYDYFIDIVSLMFEFDKSLLITDDVFYTKAFSLESRRIISSSLYILKSSENNY